MKKTLILSLTLMITVTAIAQGNSGSSREEGLSFNTGANVSLPIGDFGDFWSFGIGASGQLEYTFSDKISATALTGYAYYFGKSFEDFTVEPIGFVPVCAGAKFYPSGGFFLGAQLGVGIFTNIGGEGNSGFYIAPQVGYAASEKIDAALKFENTSLTGGSLSALSLRVGFKF